MGTELKFIAFCIYWALLLGLVAPALISAPYTELVAAGFGLLLVSAYLSYRWVRRFINSRKKKQ